MPYVGRSTDKISNIEILDNITFDGSSSYSITKSSVAFTPNSAQSLLISIDGVVQAGNFTVSGSTIDFGTAVAGTSTCDFILHYGVGLITSPSDGTVTTAKLADSSVSLAKLTATGTKDATTFLRGDNSFSALPASGITVADQWRITANKSTNNTANVFDTNLERVDGTGQGTLGTAMSVSSGEFTYPSTGTYLVISNTTFQNTNTSTSYYCFTEHQNCTDGSSFVATASGYVYFYVPAGVNTATTTGIDMVNVTNTSNVKTRFLARSHQDCQARGSTTYNFTSFTFIRLGDST
jgi:hypothetical protein